MVEKHGPRGTQAPATVEQNGMAEANLRSNAKSWDGHGTAFPQGSGNTTRSLHTVDDMDHEQTKRGGENKGA